VGQAIWKQLEKLHPDTKVWEIVTPYFEKQNIHFYVNCCGFHIVEFFNPQHKKPNTSEDMVGKRAQAFREKISKHLNEPKTAIPKSI